MFKKGFTLVELLVVISISAMLLAFIMPSLERTRENAKTVICSSNVKQLVISLQLYENENNCFPHSFYRNVFSQPPEGFLGFYNLDKRGWWWQNYLESYLDDVDKYKCPSKNISDFKLKNNILCSNYGVNMSICKKFSFINNDELSGKPLSVSSIHSPSKKILLLDSGYNMISYRHVSVPVPSTLSNSIEDSCYLPGAKINSQKNIWPDQQYDAISGRHLQKVINVAFVDGHIERKKADELIIDDSKANIDLWTQK